MLVRASAAIAVAALIWYADLATAHVTSSNNPTVNIIRLAILDFSHRIDSTVSKIQQPSSVTNATATGDLLGSLDQTLRESARFLANAFNIAAENVAPQDAPPVLEPIFTSLDAGFAVLASALISGQLSGNLNYEGLRALENIILLSRHISENLSAAGIDASKTNIATDNLMAAIASSS